MIDFVDTDTERIKAKVITAYEALAKRTLAAGDPIRLFLESIADIIGQQREIINFTGNMNLLAYSQGEYLDEIGVLVGCVRLLASRAKAQATVTLSEAQSSAVVIPAGTRITADGSIMFAAVTDTIIAPGETTASITVECTEAGTVGNGYLAGQLKQIVDPIAYVQSIVNTSTSVGGADIEDDESYRERIRIAPESFSCAGPDGAYIYWAKTASATITDVAVTSPEPGEVNIYPLCEGGELPSATLRAAVLAACNDERIRPLTDEVTVLSPTVQNYNITATYYIDSEDATRSGEIQAAVTNAVTNYVLWQKSKLGRDINPSELIRQVVNAGAKRINVTAPAYTALSAEKVGVAATISVTFGGVDDD